MFNPLRSLFALLVIIAVCAVCACDDESANVAPPDCSTVGALGPESRTVPVNTPVELEIEIIQEQPIIPVTHVSWSLGRPAGSSALLDIPSYPTSTNITNSFTPDIPGEYTVSRSVEFDRCGEFNQTATITAVEGPVADASATQLRWDVGETVTLDGSASSENVVSWTWILIGRSNQLPGVSPPPDGAGEFFSFELVEPNILEYDLTVSDGSLIDSDRVTVRSNPPSISDIVPSSGSIGDRVVINGANFSPTASHLHNKVTFNGVEASFVSGSSASVDYLEVYVPPNATSGPVHVEVLGTGEIAPGPDFTVVTPNEWELVLDRGTILNGVHAVDSDIATVVGDAIHRTEDGGQNWATQTAPGGVLTLQDVDFVDASTGYAVGRGSLTGGLVLRTTNGGQQWDVANGALNEAAASLHMGVSAIDANTATVVGNSKIFRTTDAGTSWTDQTADPDIAGVEMQDVFFIDADLGFVVGRDELSAEKHPVILRTADGGGSWVRADVPSSLSFSFLYAVHFADESNGWAVGRGSRDGLTSSAIILHTVNGGVSWTEQGVGQIGDANTQLLDVFFTDAMTGWVVSENLVYRTEDGGLTWIREFRSLGGPVGGEAIGFGGTPGVGYMVAGNPGRVYRRP